ncbi:MAG TPA: hypothetical protein VHM16_06655 [Rubrobacteraceae bacterium]|nr:hypothetical protein [Rubrobacteraceae bacterium]
MTERISAWVRRHPLLAFYVLAFALTWLGWVPQALHSHLAIANPTVQLWETALFGIGLRTVLGVPWRRAMSAGLAASVVYVLGASRFVQ